MCNVFNLRTYAYAIDTMFTRPTAACGCLENGLNVPEVLHQEDKTNQGWTRLALREGVTIWRKSLARHIRFPNMGTGRMAAEPCDLIVTS